MTIKDIGPEPTIFDIEDETVANDAYRRVAWSGRFLQVTLMSIPAGGDIGLELHADTDQFIRVEAGEGLAQLGDAKDALTIEEKLEDDDVVIVPAGKWHNVTNTGEEPLKLYSIYAPAHHKPGKVQQTQEIAEADTDDEPADWSVQPPSTGEDQHA
ncbi:MAG: cupin domain-containing protein [Brooklawnia sp.]|jgi:mannose-6-phosphate isomerase-like protein (cupin superfamily)